MLRFMLMNLKDYYLTVAFIGFIFSIVFLFLVPLTPINEPVAYAYQGKEISLLFPVGISFSAAIDFFIYIILYILFSSNEINMTQAIIDGLGLSFVVLNYTNYFMIWYVWKPSMTILPLFILIKFDGIKSLQLDLGQIVIILLGYRAYRRIRKPHLPPGPEKTISNEGPQQGGAQ